MPFINYDIYGNITEQFACQQYENQLYTNLEISDKLLVINGVVADISETPEYIAKKKEEQKAVYYQEYLKKLTQYKSAIEETKLFYELGKLTENEKNLQLALLVELANKAEEVYDAQVGEL